MSERPDSATGLAHAIGPIGLTASVIHSTAKFRAIEYVRGPKTGNESRSGRLTLRDTESHLKGFVFDSDGLSR